MKLWRTVTGLAVAAGLAAGSTGCGWTWRPLTAAKSADQARMVYPSQPTGASHFVVVRSDGTIADDLGPPPTDYRSADELPQVQAAPHDPGSGEVIAPGP